MHKHHRFLVLVILALLCVSAAGVLASGEDIYSIVLPIIQRDGPSIYSIDWVTVSPDALFINEAGTVTVRAGIPYDSSQANIPVIKLRMVDKDGNVLSTVGEMTDDGDLANGDEIARDGIFSFSGVFNSAAEERIYLRADHDNPSFQSEIVSLDYITHISDAMFTYILDTQAAAMADYQSLVGTLGEDGARAAVLADLQGTTDVLQAGEAESGKGIWILYETGILGGLILNPDGTRGGASSTIEVPFALTNKPGGLQDILAPGDDANLIKNNKAIVLGAFNWQFGATDDAPGINNILVNSACPTFDVTYLLDGAVTVDVIKTLDEYGIVAITSHGDTFYNGILSFWQDRWGWNWFSQVVFLTGQTANTANRLANEVDLRQGRLAITTHPTGNGYYAILPSFISYYSGSGYPDSLVYVGSCRSTFNNSLADAFTGAGAQSFLGYSEYVDSAFAGTTGVNFFDRLVNDPNIDNVGEAFIPGLNDGGSPAAFFELVGSTATELGAGELQDGDFESGTLASWTTAGDGRVITQLGSFSPVGGSFMGIVSTGLGFTASSGSISQQVCLPQDTQEISFSWNFSSEEFIEWCNSSFQDYFSVDIITSAGAQNVFYADIDSLCGSVFPTSLAFDQSGAGCVPSTDVGYGTGGNDCTVWSTGWQSALVDISAIASANAGEAVTIQFSAGDVGDSIFDSAILLDNITVTQP